MMNSDLLTRVASANPRSLLGGILLANPQDDDAVDELYLRVLVRYPTDRERELFAAHREQSRSRGEAYEDLLWALLNSTEFLTKR
jgi:hypothetical protein